MAYINQRVSDITGKILSNDEVVSVIVKDAGKVLDAAPSELSGLKPLTNVVEIELRHPDGTSNTFVTTQADFDKVITPEMLKAAASTRGRRPGYRVGSNND